jgi:ribosome-binding factor A
MTESRRPGRLGATLQQALGEILLSRPKDPRLGAAGLVTVTSVEVSGDLRIATVYLAATSDDPAAWKRMMDGFASAAPWLRGELGRRVALRYVPELRFRRDEAVDRGRRMEALLRDLGEPEGGEPEGGEPGSGAPQGAP